jgi:molybdate transport repressor ModE-like protein
LQTKLAIRTRGGAAGGRTVLTAQAESLLAAYQRFREEAERGIEKLFAETMEKWSC